jgi:hypothetical protein
MLQPSRDALVAMVLKAFGDQNVINSNYTKNFKRHAEVAVDTVLSALDADTAARMETDDA